MSNRSGGTHAMAFAIAALVLALLGISIVAVANRFVTDARAVNQAQAVLTGLAQIARAERDAIASQRVYLLTGEHQHREAFWSGVAEVNAAALQLLTLVAAQPELNKEMQALRPALDARLQRARKVVETHDRDGFAAAQELIRENATQTLEVAIREAIARMSIDSSSALSLAVTQSERSARWLLIAASLGVPLGLLVLGMGYLLLRREIASRRAAENDSDASHRQLRTSVEQLTSLSRDMQRLSAYASLLQTCDSIDEALDVTTVCLAALLPDTTGSVYLISDDSDKALVACRWGEQHSVSVDELQPNQCWGMRRAQPFLTESRNADVRCAHYSEITCKEIATLCLPLNAHGSALGVLCLTAPEPLRGENLAATAAEQLSLALANLKMRDSLRDQSIRDPLTGLYNRRFLERTLAIEYARHQRVGVSISVLMLDIDHFKKFNDRHGHYGGDALLSAVGHLLRESSRTGDVPCRFGGEEFTVVLPETDLEGGLVRAEAIRAAIAELRVEHEGKPLSMVTASIGVAAIPENVNELDELLEAADQALYRAKSEGRNRVLAAPRPGA